jgi:two-component system NtrC family sensor kinase
MKRRANKAESSPASGRESRANAISSHFEGASRTHSRPVVDLPSPWLSQLLGISCSLPIDSGPEAVATDLVNAVSTVVPGLTFGVSWHEATESDRPTLRIVLPMGHEQGPNSLDPARLFPEIAYERSLDMTGEHAAVRLHVASDDERLLRSGTLADSFIERVAEVLTTSLRTTRLVTAKGRESLELKGQIIQSEKLASLGQIAAGVVHELNNPLTSIVGYSEYLRAKLERDRGDPNDVERLRRIAEAAGRILKFSRDFMSYARPSIEPPSPVPIHAVVDQAFIFCEHAISRATIQIERKFAADVRPVLGVRAQLTQVFVNLITNACHAMEPQGGTLSVETSLNMQRRTISVTITDTGTGIGATDLRHIFEPFFTTKSEGRGTGLGLSIVRNIMLLHGGSIAVDSTPNVGTVFVLELPIAL